jgi:hypothetical protein
MGGGKNGRTGRLARIRDRSGLGRGHGRGHSGKATAETLKRKPCERSPNWRRITILDRAFRWFIRPADHQHPVRHQIRVRHEDGTRAK